VQRELQENPIAMTGTARPAIPQSHRRISSIVMSPPQLDSSRGNFALELPFSREYQAAFFPGLAARTLESDSIIDFSGCPRIAAARRMKEISWEVSCSGDLAPSTEGFVFGFIFNKVLSGARRT
jgi:hypothetical protein